MAEANPYMAIVQRIAEKNKGNMTISTPISDLAQYGLDNVDCPICNNTGKITRRDENGCLWSRDCECMPRRKSIRGITLAGLQDLVDRYTFDNYKTDTRETKAIKDKAMEFIESDAPGFVIMGKSGSGKTHICTAITYELIMKNKRAKYFMWRTDAAILKSMVNEGERYRMELQNLRDIDVLYIDDLFKGNVSDADINLAFTLINDRYNSSRKKTIISTELDINKLASIDEAVAGRIVEMANGYVFKAPNKNWRME